MFTDEIINEAAKIFNIDPRDIAGHRRYLFVIPARFAVYKALHLRGWSLSRIGRYLKRDHTTIINGVAKANYLAERDAKYAEKISHLASFTIKPYVDNRESTDV